MLYQQQTINCNGHLVDLEQPIVMGILNITPDSFFDGGRYFDEKTLLVQVAKMIEEGASIIDIGGMSSRPGAEIIDEKEEIKRIIPAIKAIKKQFPEAILSLDTFRFEVASAGVAEGVGMINDISAGSFEDNFFQNIAQLNVPYVLMHMQGIPENMQHNPDYDDVVKVVLHFLINKIEQLRSFGQKDIIIDPGFGFGKTIEHNYKLLNKISIFKMLEAPILVGLSRKSMIYKVLETNPENALNGTTALHMVALQNGARILRVHDVKAAVETIKLYNILKLNL